MLLETSIVKPGSTADPEAECQMILHLERYTLLRVAVYLIGEGLTLFFSAVVLTALKDTSFLFRPRVIFLGSERTVRRMMQNITPQGLTTQMMPLGNCFKIVAATDIQNAGSRLSTAGQAMEMSFDIEEKQDPGGTAYTSTQHDMDNLWKNAPTCA